MRRQDRWSTTAVHAALDALQETYDDGVPEDALLDRALDGQDAVSSRLRGEIRRWAWTDADTVAFDYEADEAQPRYRLR